MNFRPLLPALSLLVLALLSLGTVAYAATPASPTDEQAAAARLTPAALDALIWAQAGATAQKSADGAGVDDAQFLRRVSFDLIGRQPTLAEQRDFSTAESADKYQQVVERLLASEEFGHNWANYWCDTIAYRVPPPELTYLNYGPLKKWLAEKLNGNARWDEIVRELITAQGKVDDVPAATFVGYHAANPTSLAGETSRIFLGQHIGCAQCHDHPFDHWKRSQFHELAAFFARTKSKLSHNDGGGTVVSSLDKGEYLMPDMDDPRKKGSQMQPSFLDGDPLGDKLSDEQRRGELARWITSPDNPWFAWALTNRLWARTMGRGFYEPSGFYEPIDDLGDSQQPLWTEIHEAVSNHFRASGYNLKDLLRLIASTEAYRQGIRTADAATSDDVASMPLRLRGDEVFAALVAGIDLPNYTPPKVEPTGAIRFPPPPKSTRDLVHGVFGADPSFAPAEAPRTMSQALWMMNNEQLQQQIDASPESGTMLSKLLAAEADDRAACGELYLRVLAREATEAELTLALEHVRAVGSRGAAFEDLLWSLVNSAEFTTRK